MPLIPTPILPAAFAGRHPGTLSGRVDSENVMERPAAEVGDLIASRIRSRVGSQVLDLRVQVGRDGCVLRGWADSYYAKQLAQQAATEATLLPLLANLIRVGPDRSNR
jgi:hypothetical protein